MSLSTTSNFQMPEDFIEPSTQIVYENIILRIIERLDSRLKQELKQTLLENRQAELDFIFSFLKKNVPELGQIINEEVEKFQKEFSEIGT